MPLSARMDPMDRSIPPGDHQCHSGAGNDEYCRLNQDVSDIFPGQEIRRHEAEEGAHENKKNQKSQALKVVNPFHA